MAENKKEVEKVEQRLKARKIELESELNSLQDELGDMFSDVRDGINERLNVWYWIKKYPLGALGLSFTIGLLAGKRNSKASASDGVSSVLFHEIKRVALQRAVKSIVQQIENRADSK